MQHILIVEDNELVSGALRVLLESEHRRVSVAASVAGAVAAAAADPPSLVFLDLTLPDGDGLDVIGQVDAANDMVFVALTGRDDPDTARRCRDAGCTDVLVKPVPVKELVTRINHWLGAAP
jgi:two-component system, OmpR family, KDP operon response regulator KdpE